MKLLKAGSRLKSAVCETEVMVIRSRPTEFLLCCGGVEMIPLDAGRTEGAAPALELAQNTLVGKRYVDEQDAIELLCTKGGKGSLSIDGKTLIVKQAKALPSSD